MFDVTFFRTALPAQASAAGAAATVELHLLNGQAHRLRAIRNVTDGYVELEVYRRRVEGAGSKSHWAGEAATKSEPDETQYAMVSFESIAQVVITPAESVASARIGFGSY